MTQLRPSIPLASITFDNLDPVWFWALVAIAAIALLALGYRGIFQRSGRRLTWLLFALRLLGIAALLIALVKPAWTHVLEHIDRPQVAVVLDDSQSMSLLHPAGAASTTAPSSASGSWASRFALAKRWLTDSDTGRSLRDKFDVHLFNLEGQELDAQHLPKEPAAEQTDLVRGLRGAAARLRGQPAAGVVLISDGCDTTGREDFMALQEYPLPIFAIGYRQPTAAPGNAQMFDLAVNSVEAPQRVLVHNAVPINVLVSKDTGPAMDVPLQIERAGTPLMTQHVQLPAGQVQQMVAVSFTPTEPGDFTLAAHIPEQPNERTGANNVKMFKLRVEAEPIRVLYIEGELRPEYTFLKDRLANDPDVNLATFVRSASPDEGQAASALAAGELITPDRLKKIDVVLLGDFESGMLQPHTYQALRTWVEEGGAMMVLGGYHNLSDEGLGNTVLKDTLPVELANGPLTQVEEPFSFHLTPDGLRHPAMFITGDMARDAQLWDSLPTLRGLAVVGAAKPAATVLARDSRVNPDDPQHLGFTVLASQPFGKGTVAVLTADTTWRWSRLPRLAGKPDTLYVRFWSQMIRWLAHRDIQDQRPALMLSTDAAAYDRGHKVTIRVERNLASMVPGQENSMAQLSLSVLAPDGRITPLSPNPTADPNQWSATYFPDRGGRFEVHGRLIASTDKGIKDLANQVAEFLVHGSSLELDNPSTNPASMEQIATITGGLYADIDDTRGLKDLLTNLPDKPRVSYETSKFSVWNSPAMLLFFLACVCTEWIVRRRNQLL